MLRLIPLITIACWACTSNEKFSKEDITTIQQNMAAYREAWKMNDSSKVLNYISEDMILYMPDTSGKPKVGKDAVTAFWFPSTDLAYPIMIYEVRDEKIEGNGSMAYYTGISKLQWHIVKGGIHSDTTLSISEFLNVLRKENGQWKLYKAMYNLKGENYQAQ